jgi:hypothetical protein
MQIIHNTNDGSGAKKSKIYQSCTCRQMSLSIFLDISSCSVVEVYRLSAGLVALMIEAISVSETLVEFYRTTLCNFPEDLPLCPPT